MKFNSRKFTARSESQIPELNIIPMIDIMFFLLVFFMLSTMYMINLKTIPVRLPQAAHAAVDTSTTFAVTVKDDGTIYLGDQQTDEKSLVLQAAMEQKSNPRLAVVIRAEKGVEYDKVITLIDHLKGAGVARFGLAADGAKNG